MHLTPARGTERGCGRRPSRSAWQMRKTSEPLHALRLVLRTQPRSDRPTCVKCIALILFEALRSEEHTSELQSHSDLVCRLLLEKKKKNKNKDKNKRKSIRLSLHT